MNWQMIQMTYYITIEYGTKNTGICNRWRYDASQVWKKSGEFVYIATLSRHA